MPSKSKVCFFYEYKKFSLENRGALKFFIESIFKKEKRPLSSINYIFCSDKRLLEINQQFLKHDYYTDIITFDLSDTNSIHAEVYISIERVKENAKSLGSSFKAELHRVIFHGALHLCGFRDKTKTEKEHMRQKEDVYLSRYFK
ncbi:MAG TPA: rRNA maturation RNase YbeY [Chitinophagaceae bacterium]|nr:rRNA maturation RNase YbeY [Chitinophagaceae bacterium]HQZ73627.1 rRNA maturation RNase YbeY [Chitinophagaceae bacterium]